MPKLGGCTVYVWEDMQSCKTKRFYGELGYIHKDKQEYAWPNWKYKAPKQARGVKVYAVDCERPKVLDEKLNANKGNTRTGDGNARNTNMENHNAGSPDGLNRDASDKEDRLSRFREGLASGE